MTHYNTLIAGYTGQDHLRTAAIGVKAIHGNLAEYDKNGGGPQNLDNMLSSESDYKRRI